MPCTNARRHIPFTSTKVPGPPPPSTAAYPQVAAPGSAVVWAAESFFWMPAVLSPVLRRNSYILVFPRNTLRVFWRGNGSAAEQIHNPNYTKPHTISIHIERNNQSQTDAHQAHTTNTQASLFRHDGRQIVKKNLKHISLHFLSHMCLTRKRLANRTWDEANHFKVLVIVNLRVLASHEVLCFSGLFPHHCFPPFLLDFCTALKASSQALPSNFTPPQKNCSWTPTSPCFSQPLHASTVPREVIDPCCLPALRNLLHHRDHRPNSPTQGKEQSSDPIMLNTQAGKSDKMAPMRDSPLVC